MHFTLTNISLYYYKMFFFFYRTGTPSRSIRNVKKTAGDSGSKSGTLRGMRGTASAGKKDVGKGSNVRGKTEPTTKSARGVKSLDSKDDNKEKGEKEGDSEGKEEHDEEEKRFDSFGYDRELVDMLGTMPC
jgi:hypothetical protein